jgi:hypothetical protein
MTNVINFEFHRFMKESGAAMAAAKEQAKKNLDNLLAIDVSKLSGRDLRELRDQILQIKLSLCFATRRYGSRSLKKWLPKTKTLLRQRLRTCGGRGRYF